jgi:hypothetical protein
MKNRYIPKTRAMIKKTIRQKRDLISPFPKTMAASSAKGLQMDKILSPPRDTLRAGLMFPPEKCAENDSKRVYVF